MSDTQYEAYCFKCKVKKIVQNPEIITMKTGAKAVKGTCPTCGGKMFKFLPKIKDDQNAI
jgi:uncharacterized protein (DUF983 family)